MGASLMLLDMPHPTRIHREELLALASAILDEGGLEALSVRELARRLHVRAPSLYFHVESRDDLLRELIERDLGDLASRLRDADQAGGSPRDRVHRMARAYVALAEERPHRFALMFGPCPDERRASDDLGAAASEPVLRVAAELVGKEDALFFSEALWSLVHGYAMLRLAHQFRINPNHEAGLAFSLDLLVDAAERRAPPV